MQLLDLLDLHYNRNMQKDLRRFGSFVFSLIFVFLVLNIPVLAVELGGLEQTATTANINHGGVNPTDAVTQIVQWVLSFVGVIFLILMIYGGFIWMTSNGNQESIQKAQQIIGSAVLGLIIVLSAYAITIFMGTTLGARQ